MSLSNEYLPFQRQKTWNDYKMELCTKFGVSMNSVEVLNFDKRVEKCFLYFQSCIMGEGDILTDRQRHAVLKFIGFVDGDYEFDFEYRGGKIYFVGSKGMMIIGDEYICPALHFNLKMFREFLFKRLPELKNKLIEKHEETL